MSNNKYLSVDNLQGGYGNIQILNGIDLHVSKNEIVSIIGPNGSGKSTFIKVLFGLATYYSGSVEFKNSDIASSQPHDIVKMGISYVPQVNNVFPSLTIYENLEMGSYLNDEKFEENTEFVFSIFPDLIPRKYEPANTLSGGQRQMLALGRALMVNPEFLLLDEPTAALSPLYVQTLLGKIEELRDNGVTVLLIEQNAKSALKRSDRGYIFANGKVVHVDDASKLLNDTKIKEYFLGFADNDKK